MNPLGRLGLLLAILAVVTFAQAQPEPKPAGTPTTPTIGGPSDADRREAHEQYDQGKVAFEHGDYLRAARLFLAAYHLAPHHDPLWNAARAFELAGESVRAANLYALYLDVAPVDARDRDRATATRKELAAGLGRIDIQGGTADVTVDGEPAAIATVYVAPGQHIVRGRVDGVIVERVVTVSAGSPLSVALAAAQQAPSAPPSVVAPPPAEVLSRRHPLPPVVVYVGAGLTAIATGLTIASGADTLNAKSQYQHAPSSGLLSNGQYKQDRTNVLFWTTLGLGVTTGAFALLLVNWGRARQVRTGLGPGSAWIAGVF